MNTRHHGTYRGNSIIIIGHDPARDRCLIVHYGKLTPEEGADLIRVANRHQVEYILVQGLMETMHPALNEDWFTVLTQIMQTNVNVVESIQVGDINFDDYNQELRFKNKEKIGESYMVLRENEQAIVLIRLKIGIGVFDRELNMVTSWLDKEHRSFNELNHEEFETYGYLADLKQIHISEFEYWEADRL